jgi:hypothetical protein
VGAKVKTRRQQGAIELYEEAVYLLRRAPAPVIAAYYVGSLPFILGLLFFWADMSGNAFAYDHCAPASLGLALLFFWMMYWQAVFVRQLRSELSGAPRPNWFSSEVRRLAFVQVTLQPTKFLVLPAAALTLLPLAGAYSFYQNLMAVTDDECSGVAHAAGAAKRHAAIFQRQKWTVLAILALLNWVAFVNIGTAMLLLPQVLRIFMGIETVFSRSGLGIFSTTFLAVTAGLTYLVMNPLAKAVYLLRYFYAESVETGEDLRSELKNRLLQAVVCVVLVVFLQASLHAQPSPPPPNPAISVDQLNKAIDNVIHRSEFTWRMPRAPRPQNSPNWFVRVTQSFLNATARSLRRIGRWLIEFIVWIFDKLRHLLPGLGGSESGANSGKLRALIYTLLAGVALVLGWLLWQVLRRRRRSVASTAVAIPAPAVELNNPELQADQQPLDEWLQLARACMARQELRLALRALYLAGLAYLADRSLISIARGKSNQDYARELRRKARGKPELLAVFAQNMGVFERTWYGMYDVDLGTVQQFETNLARMRTDANQP